MSLFQKTRCMQVLDLLRQNKIDVLLIFPGANIAYYTGFPIGPSERLAAAVIPVDGEPYFVVNQLEEELRGMEPWFKRVEVWDEHEDPVKLLAETLTKAGDGEACLGIPEEAPWGWVNSLQSRIPNAKFVDVGKYLGYVRMVKTDEEVALIKEACRISDAAMEEAFAQIHTGMTELELQTLMVNGMQSRGASRAFAGVVFGERAALPHGSASDRQLKPGEFVLVDMGGLYKSYWSDCTRTVFYGDEPTPKQRKIYETVLAANRAALAATRPGVTCESIDVAARKVIDEAGYGEYFIHRLGHGLGMEIHEHPYMVRNNKQLLEPNMVFTDEPGIYIVGDIGVRVEDTVVCTKTGGVELTHFPRELTVYPVK
ncbi:aminopeptidase P family protein, partial [Candidatus Bathyarchaeota archaeon]